MASKKVKYVCQQCGYVSARWMGKCSDCEQWGTFVEELEDHKTLKIDKKSKSNPLPLSEIGINDEDRMLSGIKEVDRVLGGGIVAGSLVLFGGDPGIGKSTLLLQISRNIAANYGKVLYISGEESASQIKLRSKRLEAEEEAEALYINAENNLEIITEHIKKIKPVLVIIDSIQAIYLDEYPSAPGSVGQVRECSAHLMSVAKQLNIPIFLVGHVTKEGSIAGPRVLEHLVDTVLYFDSYKHQQFRILRSIKNRFGSTNEIGVFTMTEKGLKEVLNPSEIFLLERPLGVSGTIVVCSIEGSRPLLLEVQALVSSTVYGNPRRLCTGVDLNRALLMVAVLDKRLGVNLGSEDIYLNIAGGMRSVEPALDLGVCLAIASAYKNKAVDPYTLIIGEVGLTGEVRGVAEIEKRVKEAQKLGFKKCVLPNRNIKNLYVDGIELYGVDRIEQAFELVFQG